MPNIEQKLIKNKAFFYLSEQIRVGDKYKKIQVYLGKHIPNDLSDAYTRLQDKELALVQLSRPLGFFPEKIIPAAELTKLEVLRVQWKYLLLALSSGAAERLWRQFAIQFIYESNAIEGSRLSQDEVRKIVQKQYIKKSTPRREILEVLNAIKAFTAIRTGKFHLNERQIIALHAMVTKGLDVQSGFKQKAIIVNNKPTTPPGEVRRELARLFRAWKKAGKSGRHPFILAAEWHARFEAIHPFEDGNGRVGRLIFNWMLLSMGYPPILFRHRSRMAYFAALHQADEGRPRKWQWYCLGVHKRTMKEIISWAQK